VLKSVGMMPTKDQILRLPVLDLWKIRAEAAEKPIDDLGLIGRVFLHLNQRRGYQSLSKEELNDKKIGDYVKNVVGRHAMIREKGKTIGQYFYEELAIDPNFRVRKKVFPREAYKEEFDAIWNCQKVKHSHIFTKN
jgi:CRISPR-associated endonuclease Csn1